MSSRLWAAAWPLQADHRAVILGGGIAENTLLVRQRGCDGLRWCGLEMDPDQNRRLIDTEGRLSTPNSPIQAWVIPIEEGRQIAHECSEEMTAQPASEISGATGTPFPAS